MHSRQRAGWLLAALAPVALIAGCAAATTIPPPTSAPPPSGTATAMVEPTVAPPTATPSMAVFSPSASAAPLSADVLGSWTGVYRDDLTAEAHGSGLPLESAVSLVEPCSVGDECGRQWAQGADASGREVGCGWAMTYIGLFFEESGLPQSAQSPWFAFREGPPQPFGSFKHCLTTGCTDYLRPAAGGNLEFKAICEGHVLGRGSPSLEVFGPVTMTPRFGTRS